MSDWFSLFINQIVISSHLQTIVLLHDGCYRKTHPMSSLPSSPPFLFLHSHQLDWDLPPLPPSPLPSLQRADTTASHLRFSLLFSIVVVYGSGMLALCTGWRSVLSPSQSLQRVSSYCAQYKSGMLKHILFGASAGTAINHCQAIWK